MGCVIGVFYLFVLVIAGVVARTTGSVLPGLVVIAVGLAFHLVAHLLHAGRRPEQ
jgi:hypothetical protein